MKSLESNPNGYEKSSPITHASELKGNLLIVHGTEDDNVHWQNTIAFVDELIRQRKQVSTMFYPGKTHSVRGLHLYTLITDFLLKHL
jgi:dipeptidyl-peptidase-4